MSDHGMGGGFGSPPGGSGPGGFGQPPGGFGQPPGGFDQPPGAFGPGQPTSGGDGEGEPQPWTVGEALSQGFELAKGNPGGVFVPLLVGSLIAQVPSVLGNGVDLAFKMAEDGSGEMVLLGGLVSLLFSFLSLVVTSFMAGGITRFALKVVRGEAAEFGDIFSGKDVFLPVLLTSLLVGVATGIGFVLCVVPGVVLGLGLSMALPLVVDRGLGPIEALQQSWTMTTGHKGEVFLYGLASFVLVLAGFLACCVGVLFVGPVLQLGWFFIYIRLNGR